MFAAINHKRPVKAKLVYRNESPCLVASFRKSRQPLVWQLNLEKTPEFVVKIVESEGEWDFGYSKPEGDFIPVARFEEYEDAREAYDIIQKVLGKRVLRTSFGRLLLNIFFGMVFALLVVLLGAWLTSAVWNSVSGNSTKATKAHVSMPTEEPASVPQEIQTGVPMNADDVLPKGVH